jgi:hypothetical protein
MKQNQVRMKMRREPLTAWREAIREIAENGFLREADVPESLAKGLTDPMFVNPPARMYSLGGVRHGHGESNRFSTVDFFGKRVGRTQFIMINDEKFREWASTFLEAGFRAKNPHPDRPLAVAFTRYMHERNLHWKGRYK